MKDQFKIADISLGNYLIKEGVKYMRKRNLSHPSLGGIRVFQTIDGKRLIYQSSKSLEKVKRLNDNTFELIN